MHATLTRPRSRATALGLDPLYKPGELDRMSKDLKIKYESLYAERVWPD